MSEEDARPGAMLRLGRAAMAVLLFTIAGIGVGTALTIESAFIDWLAGDVMGVPAYKAIAPWVMLVQLAISSHIFVLMLTGAIVDILRTGDLRDVG